MSASRKSAARRTTISTSADPRLAAAFEAFDADPDCRCILLAAEGRNFCAGADFSAPARNTVGDPAGGHLYQQAVRLFRCETPVVAAVQGAAVGGGLGLALVADFRVAAPESRFTANFNRPRLPSRLRPERDAAARGRRAQAAPAVLHRPAHRRGGGARDRPCRRAGAGRCGARRRAGAGRGDRAVRAARRRFDPAHLAPRAGRRGGRHHRPRTRRAAGQFETEDFREGVKAMAERRPPVFRGR